MSRRRVITGSDELGRPLAAWEEAGEAPSGYGFMEPAYSTAVERRQATPEELAAARARETPEPVKPPVIVRQSKGWNDMRMGEAGKANGHAEQPGWTPHDVAALRARTGPVSGAQVLHAMAEAGEPPPVEEEAVTEDAGQTQVDEEDVVKAERSPLSKLANASILADGAWEELQAAQVAWAVADAALEEAIAQARAYIDPSPAAGVTGPGQPGPDDSLPATMDAVVSEPATIAVAREQKPRPAPRRTIQEPKSDGLTERQGKAIGLMLAGMKRADVAREMGTTYQTIDGLLEAAAKKGLLPAALLPVLPARFAKYATEASA